MKMSQHHQVIRRPLVTERSTAMTERLNKVSFEVALRANKIEIKRAVEAIYGVTVTEVNTSIMRGKIKRVGRTIGQRSTWKRAIVTLQQGDTIDFFANA